MQKLEYRDHEIAAGLVSSYQITNTTTSSSAFASTTGGWMLIDIFPLPGMMPFDEIRFEGYRHLDRKEEKLAEAYRAMSEENAVTAEEYMPLVREEWPAWEA